jgi:hypothetical protein
VVKLFFILISLFFISFADEFDDFLKSNQPQIQTKEVIDPSLIKNAEEALRRPPSEPKKDVKQTKEPYTKTILSSNKNWTALFANPNGEKVCYGVVYSKKRIGNLNAKEGEELKAYFMIHYFSPYKQRVSVFFDYKIKKGSRVFISVDGEQFELSPYESYAFAEDAETDTKIIKAILTSKRLLIRGEGDENYYSVDEYDVSGFDKIHTEMKQKCGGLLN